MQCVKVCSIRVFRALYSNDHGWKVTSVTSELILDFCYNKAGSLSIAVNLDGNFRGGFHFHCAVAEERRLLRKNTIPKSKGKMRFKVGTNYLMLSDLTMFNANWTVKWTVLGVGNYKSVHKDTLM